MDTLWMIIFQGIKHVQIGLNHAFSLLHVFGPMATIAAIALVTVTAAKLFTRKFKTRRFRELEKEFQHWYAIKQEVLKLKRDDPEKAKQLGRNIDQGKLNKVYYDYFFEGLLNNLLTMYIPIFSMLGYANYTYRPEALQQLFGKDHLFILHWFGGQTYEIGAAFWFAVCVAACYILFFLGRTAKHRVISHRKNDQGSEAASAPMSMEMAE